MTGSPDLNPRAGRSSSIGLKVVIVLAFHSLGRSVAPLGAEGSTESPLSVRASMICIVMLSALGWTAILLPLWAIAQ